MSKYTHIFARKQGGAEFVQLGCFCGSSKISEALSNAPWEHIMRLSDQKLSVALDKLQIEIENYNDSINRAQLRIKLIVDMKETSIEDRLSAIEEAQNFIEELIEERKEVESAKSYIEFLQDINSKETTLYFGCECGDDVSEKDLV